MRKCLVHVQATMHGRIFVNVLQSFDWVVLDRYSLALNSEHI